jgi:hypothetical protein
MKMNANFLISSLAILATTTLTMETAKATEVTIQGTDSIWNYGGVDITSEAGATIPTVTSLAPGVGRVLAFSSVTGAVNITDSNAALNFGPDGGHGLAINMNVTGIAGLSGIQSFNTSFLAGVFLNGHESDPTHLAPATLAFPPYNFTSLTPLDDQLFFIGDGRTGTGSGAIQIFNIPDDATKLVLGITDAEGYNGKPGAYFDNNGSFTADFSINLAAAAPESSTWAMMILGFAGIGFITYRRHKSSMLAA